MRINEEQFADLKARFEKYFQTVPQQLWFAGRKDAPSPTRQTHAVQQMFGIDLSEVGGNPAPKPEDHIEFRDDRELRVAVSRLKQWETEQKIKNERQNVVAEEATIEELELSPRLYNCLVNAGIARVSQLAWITEAELLRTKHFGRKSLNELKEVLAQVDVQLKSSAPIVALNCAQKSDLDTVIVGIKKLPEEDAREVSLCLLNLLLPFMVNNQLATELLNHFRDRLLGE